MQSRLTPSQKRRRAVWPGVDWIDAMHERCRALETLGGLLVTATEGEGAEALRPELVAGAGDLLLRQVEAVRDLIDDLRKEAR
jgi:hypothetical protein